MRMQSFSALLAAVLLGGIASGVVRAAGDRHSDPAADPAAYALLKEAHDNRCVFPAGFTGLNAEVLLNDNGKELKGTLSYTSAGKLDLNVGDASKEQTEWARDQIGSALSHRMRDDFAHSDGSNAISFGEDDHSPLGRLVALNDGMKSTYRIRDGQITEVTRTMGDLRFTITVLENKSVNGGKYLPSQFVVTYFDAGTGALKQVEAYTASYSRVSGAWVPAWQRVITAENGGFTTRTFALRNVRLLGATTAAK